METEDGEAGMIGLLQVVLGGLLTVDQIRVKHVELVSLGYQSKSERAHTVDVREMIFPASLHIER